MKKEMNKKTPDELALFLHYRKRAFAIDNKKGKGSYNRKKFKKAIDNNSKVC